MDGLARGPEGGVGGGCTRGDILTVSAEHLNYFISCVLSSTNFAEKISNKLDFKTESIYLQFS